MDRATPRRADSRVRPDTMPLRPAPYELDDTVDVGAELTHADPQELLARITDCIRPRVRAFAGGGRLLDARFSVFGLRRERAILLREAREHRAWVSANIGPILARMKTRDYRRKFAENMVHEVETTVAELTDRRAFPFRRQIDPMPVELKEYLASLNPLTLPSALESSPPHLPLPVRSWPILRLRRALTWIRRIDFRRAPLEVIEAGFLLAWLTHDRRADELTESVCEFQRLPWLADSPVAGERFQGRANAVSELSATAHSAFWSRLDAAWKVMRPTFRRTEDGVDAVESVDRRVGLLGEATHGDVVESIPDRAARSRRATELEQGSPRSSVRMSDIEVSHSPDFTWLRVGETTYSFKKGNQAETIRVLFEAARAARFAKNAGLSERTIASQISASEDHFSIRHTFRKHPAKDQLVVRVAKGVWALDLGNGRS